MAMADPLAGPESRRSAQSTGLSANQGTEGMIPHPLTDGGPPQPQGLDPGCRGEGEQCPLHAAHPLVAWQR